jgi:hypothetical protein
MRGDTISRLVSTLQNITVHIHQQFVIALRTSLQYTLQFVHRYRQEQKNEREEGDILIPLHLGIEGIQQSYYSGVGVGVYQGEFVIILRYAASEPACWIVDKLRTPDFHLLKMEDAYKLLKLAVILARHLLCDAPMNDLKNQAEIPQWNYCPHAIKLEQNEPSYLAGDVNAICPLVNLLEKELLPLLRQYPLESPQCPFERIIDLLNQGLNHSGTEPFYSYQCSTILSLLKVL